jgi:hypothetical protein
LSEIEDKAWVTQNCFSSGSLGACTWRTWWTNERLRSRRRFDFGQSTPSQAVSGEELRQGGGILDHHRRQEKELIIYFFFETGGVQIPHPLDQKKKRTRNRGAEEQKPLKIIKNPSKSSRN